MNSCGNYSFDKRVCIFPEFCIVYGNFKVQIPPFEGSLRIFGSILLSVIASTNIITGYLLFVINLKYFINKEKKNPIFLEISILEQRKFFGNSIYSIWATTCQNQQNECAPSEDSDQPGHPPSLIRVFALLSMGSKVPELSSCGQRRLWSDWADAQADLSLRWAHTHYVGFVMSGLI